MFYSRTSNSMIGKLHKRSIRFVLNEFSGDFEEFLRNNNNICKRNRNIQTLSMDVFKIKNELVPLTLESILSRRINTYYLRNFQEFVTDRERNVWYGLETLSYRFSQL